MGVTAFMSSLAALAGNFPLTIRVHRSKAPFRLAALALLLLVIALLAALAATLVALVARSHFDISFKMKYVRFMDLLQLHAIGLKSKKWLALLPATNSI
jgi:hypothetical protein